MKWGLTCVNRPPNIHPGALHCLVVIWNFISTVPSTLVGFLLFFLKIQMYWNSYVTLRSLLARRISHTQYITSPPGTLWTLETGLIYTAPILLPVEMMAPSPGCTLCAAVRGSFETFDWQTPPTLTTTCRAVWIMVWQGCRGWRRKGEGRGGLVCLKGCYFSSWLRTSLLLFLWGPHLVFLLSLLFFFFTCVILALAPHKPPWKYLSQQKVKETKRRRRRRLTESPSLSKPFLHPWLAVFCQKRFVFSLSLPSFYFFFEWPCFSSVLLFWYGGFFCW